MASSRRRPGGLNKRQKKRFNEIRRSEGADAAKEYRQGKVSKPKGGGGSMSGGKPRGIDPTGARRIAKPKKQDYDTAPGVAGAVQGANLQHIQDQAAYNQFDQANAYGEQNIIRNPETGAIDRVETNLSAPQQDIQNRQWDQQRGMLSEAGRQFDQVANQWQKPLSYDNTQGVSLPGFQQQPQQQGGGQMGVQGGPGGGPNGRMSAQVMPQQQGPQQQQGGLPRMPQANPGERQRIEQDLYGRFSRDYDKRFAKEDENFDQQMANRGISPGNPQYQQLKDDMEKRQTGAYEDARAKATQMGGTEFSRQFGAGLQARQQGVGEQQTGFQNQMSLRNQQVGEMNYLDQNPMQRYQQAMGMTGQVQNPNFQAVQPINVGNTAGIIGNIGGQQMGQQFQQQHVFPHQINQANITAGASMANAATSAEAAKYAADTSRQNALTNQQTQIVNQPMMR